jgi:hypothetical protein
MSKPVILSEPRWEKLWLQIKKDHAGNPSIFLLKSKMKDALGFSVRHHREYIPSDIVTQYPHTLTTVRLDFYSEPKRTLFLLKYSDFLNQTGITIS